MHLSFNILAMPKHESPALAARAWRLLHLALHHLRKSLCTHHHHHHHHDSYRLHCGERELSFESTPAIRSNKFYHRQRQPLFPCIDPPLISVDNKDEDEDDEEINDGSFIQSEDDCDGNECEGREKGIDVKAEEFISRFYEEMKLQRQVSWLRYNKMLYREA